MRTAIKMKIKADEANRARREEAHKMAQEGFEVEHKEISALLTIKW